MILDGKTKEAIASGTQFILPSFNTCEEVIFKASYIVASNIKCNGKVTALFDLIILGNIEAAEIDVKGKFVCLGNCEVAGSIIVQNEIWANYIRAENIEAHDRIVAQDIDSGNIISQGSIVVGKTLAIEKLAKSMKDILCGETAYGAGKIIANTIVTGDPLDLDNGEEALHLPNTYTPQGLEIKRPENDSSIEQINPILLGINKYALDGNYRDYLNFLISTSFDDDSKNKFAGWSDVINEAETIYKNGISDYTDVAIVIRLAEIVNSPFFKNWGEIVDLYNVFKVHFNNLIQRDRNSVVCSVGSYDELLEYLTVLNQFRNSIDSIIYNVVFELVISNLGLKAKFVAERLNEKGWGN